MTIRLREIHIVRLVIEQPGIGEAQIAHLLTLPVEQAASACLSLQARGAIERTATGWQRRRSAVTSFRRVS